MIIIWGKSIKHRVQGVVADRCMLCQSITTSSVEGVYEVSHLYYIPLGRGDLVQTRNRCHACGGLVASDPDRYDRLLDKRKGKLFSTVEILEQTNTRLAKEIKRRKMLERDAEAWIPTVDVADRDPRLQLTRERLAEIPADDEGFGELVEKADGWADLDEPQRRTVFAEVSARHKAAEYQRNVISHIFWATQRFTPSQWGWGGALFILLAIIGCVLVVPNAPRGEEGMYVLGTLAASLVAMLLIMAPVHRWLHRRFFRREFLPEALQRGINPLDSLARLEEYHAGVKSGAIQATKEDEPLRALAKASPRLRELLEATPVAPEAFDAAWNKA